MSEQTHAADSNAGGVRGIPQCAICALPTQHLTQVDLILLSEPSTWSQTLLAGIDPPDGVITAQWRQFGAVRMAMEYLKQAEVSFRRPSIERHYMNHLPRVSPTQALIDAGTAPLVPNVLPAMEDYRLYYGAALRVGRMALLKLEQQVEATVAAGLEPDPDVLFKLASLGARLASSQAQLVVGKGARFNGGEEEDPDEARDGFMGERPSDRFGSVRVRTIEGERRAVTDEGPKDREEYNARADDLGAPRLPV